MRIQIYRGEQDEIVGYFATHTFEREIEGQTVAILRGEPGILREYRGGNVTSGFLAEAILHYKLRHPGRTLYYLGSLVAWLACCPRRCWDLTGSLTSAELQVTTAERLRIDEEATGLMPKLRCPCGHIHDLSLIPDAGWITVLDARYEELLATEAERDRLHAEAAPTEAFAPADSRLVDLLGHMYECPSCARIMWRRPGEEEFRVYSCEPSGANGVTTGGRGTLRRRHRRASRLTRNPLGG